MPSPIFLGANDFIFYNDTNINGSKKNLTTPILIKNNSESKNKIIKNNAINHKTIVIFLILIFFIFLIININIINDDNIDIIHQQLLNY